MTKLKINYTLFGASLTGGVRVIFEVANRLVDKGHDVTITNFGNEKEHSWFPLKAQIIDTEANSQTEKPRNSTLKPLK